MSVGKSIQWTPINGLRPMGVTITRFAIPEFSLSVIPGLFLSVIPELFINFIPAKAGIYFVIV